MPNLVRHSLLLAALLPLAATAATPASFNPKPGTYRVDTQATTVAGANTARPISVETQEDGRTGDQVVRQRAAGQSVQQSYQGSGPQTVCVRRAMGPELLARLSAANACVSSPGVVSGDLLTMTQRCPSMDVKLTIRKINDQSYETHLQTRQHALAQSDAMLASIAPMKRMLEHAQQHAATPAERQKAAEQLANFDQYKAEMTRQAAQVAAMQPEIARMQEQARREGIPIPQGGTTWVTSAVQTYTRISDFCETR